MIAGKGTADGRQWAWQKQLVVSTYQYISRPKVSDDTRGAVVGGGGGGGREVGEWRGQRRLVFFWAAIQQWGKAPKQSTMAHRCPKGRVAWCGRRWVFGSEAKKKFVPKSDLQF